MQRYIWVEFSSTYEHGLALDALREHLPFSAVPGLLKSHPHSRFTFPYNILFRYFGTMTTWHLQSHRTCDKLSQSCIGFSSIIPQRGFPRGGAYIIFAGSVEPIRVHHWKWWFSEQITVLRSGFYLFTNGRPTDSHNWVKGVTPNFN